MIPSNQKLCFAGLIVVWFGYIFLRFYWFSRPGLNEWDIIFNEASFDGQGSELLSNLIVRVSSGFAILGYYLKLWFLPFPLVADYTFPVTVGWEWLRSILAFVLHFCTIPPVFRKCPSAALIQCNS